MLFSRNSVCPPLRAQATCAVNDSNSSGSRKTSGISTVDLCELSDRVPPRSLPSSTPLTPENPGTFPERLSERF